MPRNLAAHPSHDLPSDAAPLVLAIDTSCDDTAAAVTCGPFVLSNVVASQTQLHKQYGGVFPTVAKQAHRENIFPTVTAALQRARVSWPEIECLAVTQGPGLAPALEVGIAAAKQLASEHNLPLLPINHTEGHCLSVLARPAPREIKRNLTALKQAAGAAWPAPTAFPVLSLVISGNHSHFIQVNDLGSYRVLGSTIDDAAGECLDKIGRMLNFGYPAGPVIEEFAKHGDPQAYTFPLPMTTSGDFNLSFSGMKTFARNLIAGLTNTPDGTTLPLTRQEVYDLAASTQYAVFRHICYKLGKILQVNAAAGITEPNQRSSYQSVWLGGGVAANMTLRRMIRETLKKHSQTRPLKLQTPYSKRLCADNAAMIGVVAEALSGDSENPTLATHFERTPNLSLASREKRE